MALNARVRRPSMVVAPSSHRREQDAESAAGRITGVRARGGCRDLDGGYAAEIAAGPGRELDAATRTRLESAFGRDFSHVRVHTDEAAGATAVSMGAAAYTVGSDVYFAQGYFAPHTSEGSRLLAHELAHVVQNAEHGTSTVVRRAPLPEAVERSSEHQALLNAIRTADWRGASALLNAYNVEGIHSVFDDLSERQVESLYLGAILNDAVGAGSNIAKEALARSPGLQQAVAAVGAAGISIKEFVDFSKLSHGDVMNRYGFMRFFTIKDKARALPGDVLSHLVMSEDTTLYLHRSGRVATMADERAQRLREFKPHGATGTAAGLMARAVTDDPDKVEAAAATGDLVGDIAGAAAQTGAARTQNRDISAAGAAQQDRPGLAGEIADKQGSGGKAPEKGDYVSPKVGGPLPSTAGITQRPVPPVTFGGASQNVREAALGAMRADPRRGSGVGGEAAAMESRKSEGSGFDLNRLRSRGGNFPALDFSNPAGFYSAKTKDVGKTLGVTAINNYLKDLDTLVDTGGPGYAQTTAQKAATSIAANRARIQQAGAWPASLPQDASEEQILQEIGRNGRLVIPDDHVEPVRNAIAAEVAGNPQRWPGQDVAHLQQRVHPMGMTSGELDRLHKQTQSQPQ
jgi:hypothetical protein